MADGARLGIAGVSEAEMIGQGGSGRVYRARQEAFDRDVAIKIIPLYGDERTQRRFDRERRAMGRLSGVAGVLPVHESGTTDAGDLYLVMPFISGGSLREQLGPGEIGWTRACDIVEAVARTADVAHEAGIVHRDIKPGNILIGDDGAPLLADFGIARLGVDATGTTGTGLTLTPAYGPPEAFDKAEASVLGDVYSLGATLWALIAGRPPFTDVGEEPTLSQLFARVVSSPVGDLRQLAPTNVCDVIERAMAKDPAERFASAAEFADSLVAARKAAGGFSPQPGALAAGWTVKVAAEPGVATDGAVAVQAGSSRRVRVFALAAVLLAVAGIVAAVMTRGDDGPDGVATTADADAVTPPDQAGSNSGGSAGQAGGAESAADDDVPEVSDTAGDGAEVLGEAQSASDDDGEPFVLATPTSTPTPDPSVAGDEPDEPDEPGEAAEVVATPTPSPVPPPPREQPTPTPAPARTPTPAPDTSAPAPPATPTSTPRPTATPIPTPTNTPTPTPTNTPTPTPTNTPTPTPLPGPGPLGLTWFLPQFPCDGQTHNYARLTNATPGGTVSFSGPSARPGVGVVSPDGWLLLQWDCTNTEVQTFTFRAHDDATGRFVDYSFEGSANF